jgi:hypothetical protein
MSATEASLQLELAATYFATLGETHEVPFGTAA